MAAMKRTKTERERDYLIETEMYLKGKYLAEIAKEIGVSTQQIHYDLKVIQKRWSKQTILNLDEHRIKELGKIDQVERELWAAWELSKEEVKTTTISKAKDITQDKNGKLTPGGVDKTSRTEDSQGNSKYLELVLKCIERRCKILGIDAPREHRVTGKDGGPIKYSTMTDEELRAQLKDLIASLNDETS